MDYIADVPEDKAFILGDKKIMNLYGLLFEFREMNDETYGHYASADHNYFADWVFHVIEKKDLADRIREAKSRKDAIEVLEGSVESIRKLTEKEKDAPEKNRILPVIEVETPELKTEIKVEKAVVEKAEEKLVSDISKEDKEAKIFLWKHFGWEMAKEFMYGLAFGILIGLILAKMFFR
jgi:hypothetical protein